jgi:P-type conjugative transfer protein TrbL
VEQFAVGNSALLDTILAAFLSALQTGIGWMAPVALALFLSLNTLYFYRTLAPALLQGGSGAGEALAGFFTVMLTLGVWYFVVVNIVPLAQALVTSFLELAWRSPSGPPFTWDDFLHPSRIFDRGAEIAYPIARVPGTFLGWAALWNFPAILMYLIAYYAVLIAFGLIAFHVFMVTLEYYFAILAGSVLIAFVLTPPLNAFAQYGISWLSAVAVRMFTTALLLGMAVPLFPLLPEWLAQTGRDPGFWHATTIALVALLYAYLVWQVPKRMAFFAGQSAMQLTGAPFVSGALIGVRAAVRGGQMALQGGSRMLASLRQ